MTTRYFAYGTTQAGFAHHEALGLGAPAGRYRTAEAAGIVVPREPACSNPGCRYRHRMAVLVPGHWDLHPEGDVFEVDDAMLAKLDALELAGPYVRTAIALRDGPPAIAYVAAQPLRWVELVSAGLADAVETYTAADPAPKPCCVARPGHAPPHDVSDPLDRLAVSRP
jgi:gamma-glutamylcyclotransferase (GGCT)/AIG2-like uncharacterized protein YtfP